MVRANPGPSRRRSSPWFDYLTSAVEADREARGQLPDLSEDQVLDWADAYFARTGRWPNFYSGPIPESPGETWLAVSAALELGLRGFSAGGRLGGAFFARSSRRHVLTDRRWEPEQYSTRELTIPEILEWADAFHARENRWPDQKSGPIREAPDISWQVVDSALRTGRHRLPGGSSLARLFAEKRGKRMRFRTSGFTIPQILAWADAWHARTGNWPKTASGEIPDADGLKWHTVDHVLRAGRGQVRGGSSLARLLASERSMVREPSLTKDRILAWADAHHRRTGQWPNRRSGPIREAPGENWANVNQALRYGLRGLRFGSSLRALLAGRRWIPRPRRIPRLTILQIVAWADEFHARTGRWPNQHSGLIPAPRRENWSAVCVALARGLRGLPGGYTLSHLLFEYRRIGTNQRFKREHRPPADGHDLP
jgi:hypothetical protein